ncbi:MAG: lytic transglycosylase domain-containing protein [Clostridiales bacterium]|nr:lytic transglycosylase domain-containing protein [Clostridiales bacterium]
MKRVMCIIIFFVFVIIGIILLFLFLFPKKFVDEISKYSREFNLNDYMVASVINIESRYDSSAISSAGAMGLMQLKMTTALDMANILGIEIDEKLVYDVDINIRLGTKYLSYLLDMFDGNETNALASYNWGLQNVKDWMAEGNIDESGTIINIPVKETNNYLKKYKVNRFVYKNIYRCG